jgi:hypothetical protein
MATTAQIDANRANALLSTGPVSPEGKAVSARNALKLGIHANALIIPGEDPDALTQLSATFHQDHEPDGVLETELVEVLIRCTWLQRRLAVIESQVIRARLAALEPTDFPLGDMFIRDCEGSKTLDKLFRRQQALQRDFFRAYHELGRLQAIRFASEPPDLKVPANLNRVRFDKPVSPPAITAGPTPTRTPRDNWANPTLRL